MKKVVVRCLAALLLSLLSLYIFRSSIFITGYKVSFNYDQTKNIEYQLFYSSDEGELFSEKKCVKKSLTRGCGTVIFHVPSSRLSKIRIDIGKRPGKVKLQNICIEGEYVSPLNLDLLYPYHLDSYNVHGRTVYVKSNHKDPYLTYKPKSILTSPKKVVMVNWFRCLLALFVPFYLVFVLCDVWKLMHKEQIKRVPTLANLEFLRVLFTLFVLVGHFFPLLQLWSGGTQAVQFFFLLSGYLLALTYRPERKVLDMAIQRYIRFVPLVVFGGLLVGGEWKSFLGCLMLQNTGLISGNVPNAPAWYIAVLFWCTLFFTGLMKALDRKQLLLTLFVISFVSLLMVIHSPTEPQPADRAPLFGGFLSKGLLRGVACMSTGIFVAHYCRRVCDETIQLSKRMVYTAAELGVLSYIICGCFHREVFYSDWVIQVVCHVALLCLFVAKRGLISEFFEHKIFSVAARYCLAIYLTHWMFQRIVYRYVQSEYPGWMDQNKFLSISLAIIGSCVLGILAHHLVEKPCTRYLTNFINWMKQGVGKSA